MEARKQIEFDLLGNARDSLRQAVELLALKEVGSHHARLKHAILGVAHCVELLLKERLRRIHPSLIWEKVEDYPSLKKHTVTVDGAVRRLKSVGNVTFNAKDEANIESLRITRNAIEHYEWRMDEKEAKSIIGNTLSFVFVFAKDEIGIDLSGDFKADDTWRMLLDELAIFANSYSAKLEERMRQEGKYPIACDECGQPTVPWDGGSCEFCGHWQ
jgi:hypothetical protein